VSLFVLRPRQCRWCQEPLNQDALVCTKCELPQGNVYHPTPRLVGAILTIAAFPFAAWLYQVWDSKSDNMRKDLDRRMGEQESVLALTFDWQPMKVALRADCLPEHVGDARACLADYTDRLMKIDAFVARATWYIGSTPFDQATALDLDTWKNEWWDTTRVNVKKVYIDLASAPVSATDPTKQLVACQSDFETSGCVGKIDAAMKTFDADTLALFCSILREVEQGRLRLQKTMSGIADDEDMKNWDAHIRSKDTACGKVQRAPVAGAGAK
jgi:hypothetical protein